MDSDSPARTLLTPGLQARLPDSGAVRECVIVARSSGVLCRVVGLLDRSTRLVISVGQELLAREIKEAGSRAVEWEGGRREAFVSLVVPLRNVADTPRFLFNADGSPKVCV